MADQDKLTAIWYVVSQIPHGRVCTYGAVAKLAGLPGYARYVGFALKATSEDSNIPWHRVINSKGQISFPENSEAFRLQKQKLREEGIIVTEGKVNLKKYRWQPESA